MGATIFLDPVVLGIKPLKEVNKITIGYEYFLLHSLNNYEHFLFLHICTEPSYIDQLSLIEIVSEKLIFEH